MKNKSKNTETVDLQMTNITGNIDSVIKYFKVPYGDKKKSRLILKGCVLNDDMVYQIVGQLIGIENLQMDELDLSYNEITSVGCKHLASLLAADKRIKKINLSANLNIGTEGFKTIINAISQNTHINYLEFKVCNIELSDSEGWQKVMDAIEKNCSLETLDL